MSRFTLPRMPRKRLLFTALVVLVLAPTLLGVAAWRQFNRSGPQQTAVARAVREHHFDLLRYEIAAISGKARDHAARLGVRLTADEQVQLVQAYRQRSAQISRLEREVRRLYADPAVSDPAAASQAHRARLAELRALQAQLRPLVEAILERQVTETLAGQGLTLAGAVWPPLRFNFNSLPNYLIVSPRHRIEVEAGVYLHAELDMAVIEEIEAQVAAEFERSTLIEGLGGLGVWPTLVLDDASLTWILSTIAHEWVHNYLVFWPLGWRMFDSPEMNTINETMATIIGDELGQLVAFERYGIPPPPPPPPLDLEVLPDPDPDHFDFRTEMRRTRLHVDALLAAGQVEEAEAYMEERRRLFVAEGYAIRKLNQAYFAFHGSYATGAASSDPIGPKLQTLRSLTPDLATFLRLVRSIGAPEDLERLLESVVSEQ